MTKCIPELPYAPDHGWRGVGDLYLPGEGVGSPPAALVIHGGGWNAMDKRGLAGVAEMFAGWGYAAYSINYRLLDTAPWPACGEDCLAAARCFLAAGDPVMEQVDRRRLLIVGASAGGHLALMTGLRLDPAQVRGIVSIAGPADLVRRFALPGQDAEGFARRFFGEHDAARREELLADASPIRLISGKAPPLLCVHSRNDELVRPEQSERIVDACRAAGARADLFLFDGPGKQHGIWIDGTDPHRLLPEPERAIREWLDSLE